MLEYLLPVSYILAMISFGLMRKVGLAKYLKGHSISIAVGVGITVISYFLKAFDLISTETGVMQAFVILIQGLSFTFAIMKRNEATFGEFTLTGAGIKLMSLCLWFNAEECERYAVTVLGIESILILVLAFLKYRESDLKQRLGLLWALYGLFGAYASFTCEDQTKQDLTGGFAVAGIVALLLVKINHPLLGDNFDAAESDGTWAA